MLKLMNAKYRGKCSSTYKHFAKGDEIAFDTETRRCYAIGSPEHSKAKGLGPKAQGDGVDLHTAMLDEANDRWYADNYPNG